MATLTAANSVLMLGVVGIFSNAQQIQGFEVDDAFMTDPVVNAETKMGVDAHLSAGWVPAEKPMTVTIQADSPSNLFFDTWWTAEEAAQEKSVAFGNVSLPGLGQKYVMVRGFLRNYIPMPDVKRIVQARRFQIVWQSILPSPI